MADTFLSTIPKTGRTFSTPVRQLDDGSPTVWGAVFSIMVDTNGCSDSCMSDSYARRGAAAVAAAVGTPPVLADFDVPSAASGTTNVTMASIGVVAEALLRQYYATRDRINSPSLGVGRPNGDYYVRLGVVGQLSVPTYA